MPDIAKRTSDVHVTPRTSAAAPVQMDFLQDPLRDPLAAQAQLSDPLTAGGQPTLQMSSAGTGGMASFVNPFDHLGAQSRSGSDGAQPHAETVQMSQAPNAETTPVQMEQAGAASGGNVRSGERQSSVPANVDTPVQASGDVVQFEQGDQPFVDRIQLYRTQANAAHALVESQVQVAIRQITMVDLFAGAMAEGGGDVRLRQAAADVTGNCAMVESNLHAVVDVSQDGRTTVGGLAGAATIDTPTATLQGWMDDAADGLVIVSNALQEVTASLITIRNESVRAARLAHGAAEYQLMRGLLKVADDSDEALQEGDLNIADFLSATDSVNTTGKEHLSFANTVGDSMNNATTGVGFGVVGALDAANVFKLAAGTAYTLGLVGGVLGIAFGAVGLFLGVKNAIRANTSIDQLQDARSQLTNEESIEMADYAIGQKTKKRTRNIAAATGGILAISAGALGLVALTVASFGVAAIAAGIVAGLVGLGFIGFRSINNWRKRKAERTNFADQLIGSVRDDAEDAQESRRIITEVGLDPANVGARGFRESLIASVGGYVKSKRTRMAQGLVKGLIDGKPSEKFDAELVLGAIGVGAEEVRTQVSNEQTNKAVSKVAGKLASW